MNNTLNNVNETVESFQDDMVTLGKFVFNKISPKKIKEKKEYKKDFFEKLESLSDEQQNLFLDLIAYSEKFWWIDFKVPQTIEKTRPEEKDKLLSIFQWMALDKIQFNSIKKHIESQSKSTSHKNQLIKDDNKQNIKKLKSKL